MPNISGQEGNPGKNKWLTRNPDGIPLIKDGFQWFKDFNKEYPLNLEID